MVKKKPTIDDVRMIADELEALAERAKELGVNLKSWTSGYIGSDSYVTVSGDVSGIDAKRVACIMREGLSV